MQMGENRHLSVGDVAVRVGLRPGRVLSRVAMKIYKVIQRAICMGLV